jgi:micrococcal nuclease
MQQRGKKLNLSALCLALLASISSVPVNAVEDRYSATVERVIDGDTLVVVVEGVRQHIRLIGVDSPECRLNHRTTLQAQQAATTEKHIIKMGACARSFMTALLPVGQRVEIEVDRRKYDKYSRILAYIYLPNGTMVNETLISAGYAYPLTIPPNVRYQERFLKGFKFSKQATRGLWSSLPRCRPLELESADSNPLRPMIE